MAVNQSEKLGFMEPYANELHIPTSCCVLFVWRNDHADRRQLAGTIHLYNDR